KRVAATCNRDKLQTTAFLNTDGKLIVVVMNQSNTAIPYQLIIGNKATNANSLAHSIMSFVVNN
ncbi:MAG: glycosyl hydrolase, partial [Pedobacter sp.]|nr:glycosyl hydrolase [Chitinophagaceae bacterium]